MNIVQALIDAAPWMLLAVVVAFAFALFSGSHLSLALVLTVSSATLLALLSLAWFLRDGMGPDAVTSTGLEAARRVSAAAAALVGLWLLINGLAFVRYRSQKVAAA